MGFHLKQQALRRLGLVVLALGVVGYAGLIYASALTVGSYSLQTAPSRVRVQVTNTTSEDLTGYVQAEGYTLEGELVRGNSPTQTFPARQTVIVFVPLYGGGDGIIDVGVIAIVVE